jgi:hypothetical protein
MPQTGMSRPRNAAGSVRPISPYDGTTSGSALRVGHVSGAAGQPRDDVGVDGADDQAAVADSFPRGHVVLRQPGQLRGGEVGIEPQPGEFGDPRFVPGVLETVADARRTAVLPHDGAPRRRQSRAIPDDRGLPLVGDPDGGDRPPLQRDPARLQDGDPDLLRLVLHLARSGEVLGELLVATALDLSVRPDHEGGDAGRSGVDGQQAHWLASRSLSRTMGSMQSSTIRSS